MPPPEPIDAASPQAFYRTAAPFALAVEAETGLPADVTLAVAALESAYGQVCPAPGNYFGIKGEGNAGSADSPTFEYEDGIRVDITDRFAAYRGNPMAPFAAFLRDNPRYHDALETYRRTGDPDRLIDGVHAAGYATAPYWADSIRRLRREAQPFIDRPAPAEEPPLPFNPEQPTELQRLDWTCAIRTVTWMLRSIGISITAEALHDRMVPGLVDDQVGLRDARGVGLVEVLGWFGISGGHDEAATFDELLARAGAQPVGLGLRNWGGPGLGHWSAVRGAVDGALVLANPAGTGPRYGQATLSRDEFEQRGPASMVWADTSSALLVSGSARPDQQPGAGDAELVSALAYVCDDLGDQLGAVRGELRRVREQFMGPRPRGEAARSAEGPRGQAVTSDERRAWSDERREP